MSMEQVYLIKHRGLDDQDVFSSRQKAISYFNRLHSTAEYRRSGDITYVTVHGDPVGCITKKMVQ